MNHWTVVLGENSKDGAEHTIPQFDKRPHEAEENCWCEPDREPDGSWTHHARDGRGE